LHHRRDAGDDLTIGLLLAAALMQAGDPCQAVPQGTTARSCPPWRFLRRTEGFEYFVNPASIAWSSGTTFEISLRIVYVRPGARGRRSAIARQRVDCAIRTGTLLHFTAYNGAGIVVDDRDARPDEARLPPAPPGSPGSDMMTEYCPH
jgi:hypothetical protein